MGVTLIKHKTPVIQGFAVFSCDSGGTRTPNRQNRNLLFYPIELRSHRVCKISNFFLAHILFNGQLTTCPENDSAVFAEEFYFILFTSSITASTRRLAPMRKKSLLSQSLPNTSEVSV